MKEIFHIPSSTNEKNCNIIFAWSQDGEEIAFASTSSGKVHIHDKAGRHSCTISISDPVQTTDLAWANPNPSEATRMLAILKENGQVILWSKSTVEVAVPRIIDTQFQDASHIRWSSSQTIAVLTRKGNVVLIDTTNNDESSSIIGKHAGPILSGVWVNVVDKENNTKPLLVLGGQDNIVTISNADGDTIDQIELAEKPLSFSVLETDQDTLVSINVGGKTIHVHSLVKRKTLLDKKVDGHIMYQELLHDGNILVALQNGCVLIVSSDVVGSDDATRMLDLPLIADASFCHSNNMLAIKEPGNNGSIGVYLYDELNKSVDCNPVFKTSIDGYFSSLQQLKWCETSCMLSVGAQGGIYGFASLETSLYAFDDQTLCLAFVSSLMTVEIHKHGNGSLICKLDIHPTHLAIGEHHFAVAKGKRVILYRLNQGFCDIILDKKLKQEVDILSMNGKNLAVLSGNEVKLYCINSVGLLEEVHVFPDQTSDEVDQDEVTIMSIAKTVLSYGTKKGQIKLFSLTARKGLASLGLHHKHEICQLVISSCCDIIFKDSRHDIFILDLAVGPLFVENLPFDSSLICNNFINQVFHLCKDGEIASYSYKRRSSKGPGINRLGSMSVEEDGSTVIVPDFFSVDRKCVPFFVGHDRIMCYSASDFCQKSYRLPSYLDINIGDGVVGYETLHHKFTANLAVLELERAWAIAFEIDSPACMLALANEALRSLNVKIALR